MFRLVQYLLFFVFASAARAGDAPDFDRGVAPILIQRCLDCHGGVDPKGKLDLSARAPAMKGGAEGAVIVPGQPDESVLWEKIDGDEMPPKHPLPAAEKAAIKAWIVAGARWGSDPIDAFRITTNRRAGRDWWALRAVSRPDPPEVARIFSCVNPIDRFVIRELERKKLAPAPMADRRTLVRRLSFDLLGLPPTPEEVEAFVNDPDPDAYARLVDRLLAAPAYGVRWARLWLDLARYGESNGFEHDEFRPAAWPYRDWVVNALNADMPYDEFVRLQVAGDVLRPADPSAIEATGFLAAGAYDSVGQTQQSEVMRRVVRQDELEDVVGTVSQTFLGLTVHCARCHDHKFDPIRQADYYRLTATFAGVHPAERDLSSIDPEILAARRDLGRLVTQLDTLEASARRRLAERAGKNAVAKVPAPLARWDFEQGADDLAGPLIASLSGKARLDGGLVVDGSTGFATTVPLNRDLHERTLEAWVRLDNPTQRGGAAMGVQTLDGARFDAIVFGEREPGRWMAGSEGFARYQSFGGPKETETTQIVQIAITYAEDGTVTAYRNGKFYGKPYKTSPSPTFYAGNAQLIFGMRHGTAAGGNRMLAGRIVRARLYDRALSADEVAASAESGGKAPSAAELAAELPEPARLEHRCLLKAVSDARASLEGKTRRAYAVSPGTPEPTFRLIRGNPATRAERIEPGAVEAASVNGSNLGLSDDAPEAARRIALANWLTDPANPLTPRVIVNRLWQAHFGAGIVETPSDLGFNGGRPSHPELLDWLASQLVARGWSLKAIHRLIVTSATYRQSSRSDSSALAVDASNRLLWHKPAQRLEAEMVRDAMLSASGILDRRTGGPGFFEFKVSRAIGTTTNQYVPIEASGPESDRRTLYRTWARGGRNGFLDAFDCPDPSTVAPRRVVTTTPLQALAMLNNALTLRLADRFAERLRREVGEDPDRQVERAYRLALGRPPIEAERIGARTIVARFGSSVLARAIFNSNEFLYID